MRPQHDRHGNALDDRAELAAALDGFTRHEIDLAGRKAAAVALAIVRSGSELGIWLTRRGSGLRTHSGQWALPGGRLDRHENQVDAALRELREELGVTVPRAEVLGTLDDYPTRSGYVITPVVAWVGEAPPLTPNRDEVAEVHWIPFADLDIEPLFRDIPESDRPLIQLPLLDTVVHAPTAAVLYQFREVLLHRRHTRVAQLEQPPFAWR